MSYLNVGDLVTIVCEIPFGLWENDVHVPHVKGNVGIITKFYDENRVYVKDTKGNQFVYSCDELIHATSMDIANALAEMLDRR